jgi:hypothetical protein
MGGWCFIVRDDQGDVVLAGTGNEKILMNAFHAELLGCLAGASAAAQLGLHKVVFEIDPTLLKSALDGEDYLLSSMGGIITELKLVLSDFVVSSVQVCPITCNRVADALASYMVVIIQVMSKSLGNLWA